MNQFQEQQLRLCLQMVRFEPTIKPFVQQNIVVLQKITPPLLIVRNSYFFAFFYAKFVLKYKISNSKFVRNLEYFLCILNNIIELIILNMSIKKIYKNI